IIAHCIKRRLLWRTSFVRKVCRESEYYEDMMCYLRKNLALFPYHLAEYVCRVMRVSPFRYYCDMLFEVMKNGSGFTHYRILFILLVTCYYYYQCRCSDGINFLLYTSPQLPYDATLRGKN
nr:hypothetical protein [Tanacetum cinerariifolium]